MSSPAREILDVCAVIDSYFAHLTALGAKLDQSEIASARVWCRRFGSPQGFAAVSLEDQLDVPRHALRFIDWLIATQQLVVTADYVMARRPKLGLLYNRFHADFHAAFVSGAAELGFEGQSADRQWTALAQACAVTGAAPERISVERLISGCDRIIDAASRLWSKETGHNIAAAAFGLEATLFHLGVIERVVTTKHRRTRARSRDEKWADIPAELAATFLHYLDHMAVSMRSATIERYEVWLRAFAVFLTQLDPPVIRVADVERTHIEGYKIHLAQRASGRGKPLNSSSVRDNLIVLRVFFDRLIEWDHSDAPARCPIFSGDIPIKNKPLPKFLDDASSAKVLRTARDHPDLFTRVCVEVLARTGLRRSELLGLTISAIVQIGSSWWLKVPVGKLHNDRFIPLHPNVKALLDEWLAVRPAVRSELMFVEHGRPIGVGRVNAAVKDVAARAGLGKVTPHQLRHTLATQAINRGMSLEAIAALLGHQSMDMTLTYARIADRTVADEYFAVSEKVEALYDKTEQLPADAEGLKMASLRREMHERMLGNGYCSRPPELDCQFESICESCTFFRTTIDFLPTLRRQRDDAAAKGQSARRDLFDGLIARADEEAS
ncbi:MAG: tyrosine-type recombinase/integrase [Actinomycetota bacterium]